MNYLTDTDLLDKNIILMTDYYKQTHHKFYDDKLETVYSYFESRGGEFDSTLFFGLQYYLKKYLEGPVVTQEMIDQADQFLEAGFFGMKYFNREGWQYILDKHNGRLPILIKAVNEGRVIPAKNILFSIENTDPKVPFITNFVETLLMKVWYPTTVATLSKKIKDLLEVYAELCGTVAHPFMLNDFGYRGVSSEESAGIGGAAHLVNFQGTDTIKGIVYAMKYYNQKEVCGFSVAAAEHSTVTSYGKENEAYAYSCFIEAFPNGILSVVSDSYDIYNAVENIYGKQLKEKILAREGKFVVRPDSGDPTEVSLKVIEGLWKAFGGTVNDKGYKVLNPKVGVIYGDGINYESIDKILKAITDAGYSIDNIVFGMGGALLQQVNRDTNKFALKCSAARVGGQWIDVFKDPITDHGKVSKKGILELYYDDEEKVYFTDNPSNVHNYAQIPQLETVFENGKIVKEFTFDEVKFNSNCE